MRLSGADTTISAREAEVLAAVGEHLSNAEIAARLVISIRTVESHVSSLLRKLGASDRRELSLIAAERSGRAVSPARKPTPLPSALTSFVGREHERAELAAALRGQRLVTAVGPGGVGKTRLALAVAAQVAEWYADGVWYVDLVPVTDETMIASTAAAALGIGEQQGRSALDTVQGWAAEREALLVLDNCEHVLDGVVEFAERLLAHSEAVVVLATSRARLLLPFERVFLVGGLSVEPEGGGDAVALFEERAASAGAALTAADRDRVARICRGLDGVPLAIELAAARLPALGLDGLEDGLADRLQLLTGARRVDSRHRSLRSTLDWSYALLDPPAQAVLRRVSVFAGPFRVEAAASVVSGPSVGQRELGVHLAALADHSLLVPTTSADGTRYRALEAVRQYGAELLEQAGELVEYRTRHLKWAMAEGEALLAATSTDSVEWRASFDQLADELRAAVGWVVSRAESREVAYGGKVLLAVLCHRRGMPGESQWRYEQAAALAPDDGLAAVALHRAASAALSRLSGEDAKRLHRAAADAALRAGLPQLAARDLAMAAEQMHRCSGIFSRTPDPAAVEALLAEARRYAGNDLVAQARIAIAAAFSVPETDPHAGRVGEHALELARRSGDLMAESAALDRLSTVHLTSGEAHSAMAHALRRVDLLAPALLDPAAAFEIADAHVMSTESAIAAGELPTARRIAERIRDNPQNREIGHVAVARLIVVCALMGDWDVVLAAGDRFYEGWARAGKPRVPTLRRAAHALALVHGLRGDTAARAHWLEVFDALVLQDRPSHDQHPSAFFDAVLALHLGRPEEALERLSTPPDELRRWYQAIWRPWYAAAWAEAAVVAGLPDAGERVAAVRATTADNPVAFALVDRAAGLLADRPEEVVAAGEALRVAGCRYQWARSLLLAGGAHRERGVSALVAMGAAVG